MLPYVHLWNCNRWIIVQLQRVGSLVPRTPEGYQTINGIRKSLGMTHSAIARTISKLGDELGSTEEYRFGSRVYPAYSPRQMEILYRHLGRL